MTTTAVNVSHRLAEYALSLKYEGVPEPVRRRTRELFLDFLGVALGGRQVESTPPILAATRALLSGGSGPCTVVGEAQTFPAHLAAMLNATLAHSMDFDDTHAGAVMHIGTPVFATLLALAEEKGSSGRDFLTAAVAGYDVGCKIGKGHGESVHHRGFHPSATTGVFAATAAGGRLLGMAQPQVLNALGLNVSQAAGSQQFLENGAWNKRLHVGLACHNAIYSLAFAREGFKGAVSPIEGRFGYYRLYCQDGYDLERAVSGLGTEFEVMATAVKPYPCCRYNHGPIDAVVDLVRQHDLRPTDIAAIDVYMPPTGHALVGEPADFKRRPSDVVEGQFSVFFAAAVAALWRRYGWDAYGALSDPQVQGLMQKVHAHADPGVRGLGARTVITTTRGQRLTMDVPAPKGEPENPLAWEEMAEKFRSLATGVLGAERTRQVIATVGRLDSLADVRELTRLLRG
ncbi:MAG: MmgE/PrpD family protein [Chloroflexi bacterium]|nr:MmgE/PrpD family protein [Chloroflexota bacterium]